MTRSPADSDPPGASHRAWRPLPLAGLIRVRVDDFRVSEELGFEPDGEGEHCLLHVRKSGANTIWAARRLAEASGCSPRDVGFAGLKDRHSVSDQWFSLPARVVEGIDHGTLRQDSIEVLSMFRHRRKLRRGAHAGNLFQITVRSLEGDRSRLQERLARIGREGVPNYFGMQRFGRDGRNLALARKLGEGRHVNRRERGFALSAARALMFNEVLDRRVAEGSWNRLQTGDAAGLAGSRSFFLVTGLDEALEDRARRHDIHPTGPMWGDGDLPTKGSVRDLEMAVAEEFDDLARCLATAGLKQERRSLRLIAEDLAWELEPDSLTVGFRLTAGSFATSVLRELLSFTDARKLSAK